MGFNFRCFEFCFSCYFSVQFVLQMQFGVVVGKDLVYVQFCMYFGYFEMVVLKCVDGFIESFVFGDIVYCYFKGVFGVVYEGCSFSKMFFSKIGYYVFEIFIGII